MSFQFWDYLIDLDFSSLGALSVSVTSRKTNVGI